MTECTHLYTYETEVDDQGDVVSVHCSSCDEFLGYRGFELESDQ